MCAAGDGLARRCGGNGVHDVLSSLPWHFTNLPLSTRYVNLPPFPFRNFPASAAISFYFIATYHQQQQCSALRLLLQQTHLLHMKPILLSPSTMTGNKSKKSILLWVKKGNSSGERPSMSNDKKKRWFKRRRDKIVEFQGREIRNKLREVG